ncbi:hypothetical protein ABW19_dt0209726 [Dactylella cylindrospora]|nr:hypothetical protein ABW19_dt0209726 [Dactylella cylindrospora]
MASQAELEKGDIPVTISENAQLLLLAAKDHNLPTLRSILRNQTPNVQDPDTLRTPLHVAILACEGLKPSASDSANGADSGANGKPVDGDEFSLPTLEKAQKTLELLLQNGAIWNSLDVNNETPGCIANRLKLTPLYEVMVDAGVRAELLFGRLDGYVALDDDDDDDEDDDEDEDIEMEVKTKGEAKDKDDEEVPELVVTSTDGVEKSALDKAGEEAGPVTSDVYLSSQLEIDDDRILDEDKNGVMMSWETHIMSLSATQLLPNPDLKVLNIGYGMGIIDNFFQSHSPSSHHIVEAHPQIIEKLSKDPISKKPGVVIHSGRWQEVLPKLVEQGEVFDAIYFDTFAEDYSQLKLFFEEYVIALLSSEGRFGFFNGLGADRQIAYDVYKKVVELELLEAGLEVEWTEVRVDSEGMGDKGEWKGVRRKYWDLDRYWLPTCRFMG